mmetsp:Transcript_15303/g.35082  ORF Transcript_15303/g.35082 Transcript_15303/m.35082 type:complete len:209 (-) Transcript_15303:589-1215(-)
MSCRVYQRLGILRRRGHASSKVSASSSLFSVAMTSAARRHRCSASLRVIPDESIFEMLMKLSSPTHCPLVSRSRTLSFSVHTSEPDTMKYIGSPGEPFRVRYCPSVIITGLSFSAIIRIAASSTLRIVNAMHFFSAMTRSSTSSSVHLRSCSEGSLGIDMWLVMALESVCSMEHWSRSKEVLGSESNTQMVPTGHATPFRKMLMGQPA